MAPNSAHEVNYGAARSFGKVIKSNLKETFFPDDPFHELKNEPFLNKTKKTIQYFVPIFEWLPKYSLSLFKYDLLAGITIASLAIPQGISYAKLANIPPIIGLCKINLIFLVKYYANMLLTFTKVVNLCYFNFCRFEFCSTVDLCRVW